MDKVIDFTKPIYWQEQYGSYDVCIPPYDGYQVTKERDHDLFEDIERKIKSGEVITIPEPAPPPPTPAELTVTELTTLKSELLQTDYIPLKIQEAVILGEDSTILLEKYKTQLLERKSKRVRIKEIELLLNPVQEVIPVKKKRK